MGHTEISVEFILTKNLPQKGTTPEGIHLGAMAGTVNVLLQGYTGLDIRGEALYLQPHLPKELTALHLDIHYCGQSLALHITSDTLRVTSSPCAAGTITLCVNDTQHRLETGEVKVFRLE